MFTIVTDLCLTTQANWSRRDNHNDDQLAWLWQQNQKRMKQLFFYWIEWNSGCKMLVHNIEPIERFLHWTCHPHRTLAIHTDSQTNTNKQHLNEQRCHCTPLQTHDAFTHSNVKSSSTCVWNTGATTYHSIETLCAPCLVWQETPTFGPCQKSMWIKKWKERETRKTHWGSGQTTANSPQAGQPNTRNIRRRNIKIWGAVLQ